MFKVYVRVYAEFTEDGNIIPKSFIWKDRHGYEIDSILDVRPAASLKAGGNGIRYTVKVKGKQTYMWLEDGKQWFMEEK